MGKHGTGKEEKKCPLCNKLFNAWVCQNRKFCSKSCLAKGRDLGGRTYIKFTCKNCGKNCSRVKAGKRVYEFCNRQCMFVARGKKLSGENHPNWNGGISERPFSARKAITELRKTVNNCQKCGSIYRLQGHHIIHYAAQPELTNDKKNIIILCVNCHAKEHPKYANLILKGGNYNGKREKIHS